ncbi:predicted protein [Naegleria gruberi]|uniref:Predicted protein n=1 Tax=Naegleria gruberi TaxID=5762 RepID=D2VAG4_NAEGR|nr:uncharacterized protein NAEGRDRAFT_65850 [Naegleria gruberi]EFC46065.1 predicted protein [Naegleria gruberi]|eukprot:XP_002678809.1 predicted protein [Naegleria gruberi strain NEG-M]
MKLVNERDNEEYIYVSNNLNMILKIKVSDLLQYKQSDKCTVWSSEQFDNVWGIEVFNDKVYAMDYTRGIVILNCNDGKIQVENNLPSIASGYELKFLSENELLISHGTKLEIFKSSKKHGWKPVRKSTFPIVTAYSLFYEEGSQLIYLSDSSGHQVHVVNRHDLSLVKSFGQFNMNFGIKVDKLSGLLYICDTCNFTIEVYQ